MMSIPQLPRFIFLTCCHEGPPVVYETYFEGCECGTMRTHLKRVKPKMVVSLDRRRLDGVTRCRYVDVMAPSTSFHKSCKRATATRVCRRLCNKGVQDLGRGNLGVAASNDCQSPKFPRHQVVQNEVEGSG